MVRLHLLQRPPPCVVIHARSKYLSHINRLLDVYIQRCRFVGLVALLP